ncbi:hypothetical protein CCB81_11330 [Armatimonadetes bacterium Uphvl-Ar2]|nr:hypothetical protein CCB81_11330 [Armatimonadetes bacterium Uphvl-Ar2]
MGAEADLGRVAKAIAQSQECAYGLVGADGCILTLWGDWSSFGPADERIGTPLFRWIATEEQPWLCSEWARLKYAPGQLNVHTLRQPDHLVTLVTSPCDGHVAVRLEHAASESLNFDALPFALAWRASAQAPAQANAALCRLLGWPQSSTTELESLLSILKAEHPHPVYFAPRGIWLRGLAHATPEGEWWQIAEVDDGAIQGWQDGQLLQHLHAWLLREQREISILDPISGSVFLLGSLDAAILPDEPRALAYQDWLERWHDEDRGRVEASEGNLLMGHDAKPKPIRLLLQDGTTRVVWNHPVCVPTGLGGRPVVVGLLGDTPAVENQDGTPAPMLTPHQDRLMLLGGMTAEICHEIHNPLTALRAHAELLADHPEPEIQLVSESIQSLITRAIRILNRTRKFARSGQDAAVLVNPWSPVKSAAEMLMARFGASDVAIEMKTKGNPGPAWLREAEIEQVLINLMVNAVQAVSRTANGHPRVVVEAELGEDQVAYTVSDNGPGIPKAIREKVFEPYFTTKGAEDGTGLGLAICRKLTDAHGGTITLNSSPQGTQVRVTFPYLAAPSVTFSA